MGKNLLSEVMEKNLIDTVFQPIVDLRNGEIVGYEALSRGPKDSALYSPMELINEAKCQNRLDELDSLLNREAVQHAAQRGLNKLLFVNLDPTILYKRAGVESVLQKLGEYGLRPESIVVEFSERSAVSAFSRFQDAVLEYRKRGFRVACDDVGAEYASRVALSKIEPDFVKIDDYIIRKSSGDTHQRSVISSILLLSKISGSRVIAEGVETQADLAAVMELGVPLGQGNFLGLPEREFQGITGASREFIRQNAGK